MNKITTKALVQSIEYLFAFKMQLSIFNRTPILSDLKKLVNFVKFIRFVNVTRPLAKKATTKKPNTTRTQRESKMILGPGGRLSCRRRHARSEPINGNRHRGALHQRGQDPGKTTRW